MAPRPRRRFGAVSDTLWARRVKEGLWELISSRVTVPAFEDLKGSGRLGLLPPEVRAAMTDLEGLAEGLDGDSDDNFQYQIRNLDPWLLENAPLRSILRYDRAEPTEVLERLPDAVLRSRRVENMLLAKLELLTTLETQIVRTRALTVRILALLGDPVPEAAPGER